MNILDLFKKPNTYITQTKIEESQPIWISKITPLDITTGISQAERGYLRYINALYDKLYRFDDTLGGDTDVRFEAARSAVAKLPEGLSKQQEEFFQNVLKKHLPTMVADAIELKLRGSLFKQIIFNAKDNLVVIDHFENYKNLDLRIVDKQLALFHENEKKQELPELNFIMLYKDTNVYESIIKYYAFAIFALNNWASFVEMYGKPIRIGKYRPGTPKDERNVLKQMVQNLGASASAVISENTMIEFVDFKNASANPDLYQNLMDFCSISITKRILGQALTTQDLSVGSYALGNVQDRVRQDILLGDLRDASNYISNILTRLYNINWGEGEIEVELSVPEKADLSERINIDVQLNNIIDIPAEYFYDTYGIPEPQGGPSKKADSVSLESFGNEEKEENDNVENRINRLPFGSRVLQESNNVLLVRNTLKAITEQVEKLKSSFTSYEDILNAPFPTDLHLAYGKELAKILLLAYKKASGNIKNSLGGNIRMNSDFEIDWNMPDLEALHAFRKQAFKVAGVECAETLAMLKIEAEKAFTQGITFQSWKENIRLQGFESDNPHHLKTNFNMAIAGATASARWKDIWELRNILPYLRYQTMEDPAVRDDHARLNGYVKKVTDPWWQKNYPPNDWGCRCGVVQLSEKQAQKEPLFGQEPPDISIGKDFSTNVGEDNNLWDDWLEDKEYQKGGIYEFSLSDWSKVEQPKKTPNPLEFATPEEKIKYYQENIKGLRKDAFSYPNNFDDDLLGSTGSDDLNRMNLIQPTIKNPSEIWMSDTMTTFMKKYPDLNTAIIVNIAGTVIEFKVPTDEEMEELREGVLIKK